MCVCVYVRGFCVFYSVTNSLALEHTKKVNANRNDHMIIIYNNVRVRVTQFLFFSSMWGTDLYIYIYVHINFNRCKASKALSSMCDELHEYGTHN